MSHTTSMTTVYPTLRMPGEIAKWTSLEGPGPELSALGPNCRRLRLGEGESASIRVLLR